MLLVLSGNRKQASNHTFVYFSQGKIMFTKDKKRTETVHSLKSILVSSQYKLIMLGNCFLWKKEFIHIQNVS